MHAGMDEAGRGPIIGPFVVAAVGAEDPGALKALGVRDSKKLSPARRVFLDGEIRRSAARVELVEVSPHTLDERMQSDSLNDITVDLFAELGRRIVADTYYLDACDTDADRFGRRFLERLGPRPSVPNVVSEHKADATHPLCSAASILAKVRRDAEIAKIAARLEPRVGIPMGSGYPSDKLTVAFLEKYMERIGQLPEEARRSWKPSKRLMASRLQKQLSGF